MVVLNLCRAVLGIKIPLHRPYPSASMGEYLYLGIPEMFGAMKKYPPFKCFKTRVLVGGFDCFCPAMLGVNSLLRR